MKLLIVGVCLLFSLSQGFRLRQQTNMDNPDFEEFRTIFRDTLLEMVGLSINITLPELTDVGRNMKQCEKRISVEREGCIQCRDSHCNKNVMDNVMNGNEDKMNFGDLASLENVSPETLYSDVHGGYGYGGDGFGTMPDQGTHKDKRILFSTIAAGALAGLGAVSSGITIGSFVHNNWSSWFGRKRSVGFESMQDQRTHKDKRIFGAMSSFFNNIWSNWFGRKRSDPAMLGAVNDVGKMMPEQRTCLRKCLMCKPFMGDRQTLMLKVCGEKLMLKFAVLSVRMTALKGLYEHLSDPTQILERAEITNEEGDRYLQVTAMFPSGPHTYDSLVPLTESPAEMAKEAAVEYFELWSHDRS